MSKPQYFSEIDPNTGIEYPKSDLMENEMPYNIMRGMVLNKDSIEFIIKIAGGDERKLNIALRWASEKFYSVKDIKKLIEAGADPSHRMSSSLDYAIRGDNLEVIKLLLDSGAEYHQYMMGCSYQVKRLIKLHSITH